MMKKNFDPVREAMLAPAGGAVVWALSAAMSLVYLLLALKGCASMEGGAVVALIGAFCCAAMIFCFAALVRENRSAVAFLLCAGALFMLAATAHLTLLDVKPGRYTKTLAPMLEDMWNYELVSGMAWEDDFWSGGYLIFCALISRLEHFSQLYAIKLFDLVCASACACAAMRLSRLRGAGAFGMLASAACCMLAPTVLLNAGVWAQCDAVFAACTLWGLALVLGEHRLTGSLLLGVALAFKLQSAFVFPILLALFMEKRFSLRHFLLILAAFVLTQIAIPLDGQEFSSIFTRYAGQLELLRGEGVLTDWGPGVFGLVTNASTREFSGMGLYLSIACAVIVVIAMLRGGKPLTNRTLLLGALLLSAGLPLVLPQMNARCLYLGVLLAFICADNWRLGLAATVLETVSLLSYAASIFQFAPVPLIALSLAAIGAALLIALEFVAALHADAAGKEASR